MAARLGLRARIVLMLLVTILPMVTIYSCERASTERTRLSERRMERVAERLIAQSDRLCRRPGLIDAPPRALRQQLRGTSLTFYDAQLAPLSSRNALPLSERQRLQLEALDVEAFSHHPPRRFGKRERGPTGQGYTLGKLSQDSPNCAAFLITWPNSDRQLDAPVLRLVLPQALLLTLLLLATGLLLSVPLVRRIRKLTAAIRDSSSAQRWHLPPELLEELGTDELGELAVAYNEAGDAIQDHLDALHARDQTLKEYIANTTHDLAIPLTVLQHRLRRLQVAEREGESIDRAWIDGAIEESHYIAALIANMSAAAKLEAGAAHQVRHEVALGELIERVVARHEPIATQRQIELGWSTPETPMIVLGDATLIERVLSNLVQNAIQYHDGKGHVAIILETSPASSERFELSVLDDGPGVPEALLGQLGQRATRGDEARNRNPGGQGFGLSIVARVCAQHRWQATFEHSAPHGLRVRIEGPLHAHAAARSRGAQNSE